MAIVYENKEAKFSEVIYEDDVPILRDFLQTNAGESIAFDFTECDDMHLAILQLIVSYQKNYPCDYKFDNKKKIFELFLRGFNTSENYCN